MNKNHNIIIIPGLIERKKFLYKINKLYLEKRVATEIYKVPWLSTKYKYVNILSELTKKIGKLSGENKVSLIGTSAGGSVAINSLAEMGNRISKVVCICSPLRDLKSMTLHTGEMFSRLFKESIDLCEKNVQKLTIEERKKVMTIIPKFDELVPLKTMALDDSKELHIKTKEHFDSINKAMTTYSHFIFRHLELK
jgi:hypothetical protein